MSKRMVVIGGLLAALLFPGTVFAGNQPATGPAMEIQENQNKDEDGLEAAETAALPVRAAENASQLIVVIGNPPGQEEGRLDWYVRDEAGKLTLARSAAAFSGKNGITPEKREGDKKTPEGVYSFSMAFGLKEDPGSALPYHRILPGDVYVDDSASWYYNRLVNENEVEKDWNSAENLIRQAPHYNYGLVIRYNEACEPGKGSAIFLHCNKISENKMTSGCVSIPEETMKELVCRVDADTRIVIVPDESALADY